MAIYHLNVRYCSKSKGQSAQAKNDYINRNDKYSKRLDDLQFSGYGNMPKFAEDNPQEFWQLSDIYERANARVCTEIVFALPRELDQKQQQELVSSFINSTVNTERNKLPYSFAIHNDKGGNNPHCHLIFSERQLDGIDRSAEQFFKRANSKKSELGGAKKTADFRDREFIKSVRKTWSEQANLALEKYGHSARIDERSYQEQGIDKEPRSRLDRVTWQELKSLEKESEKLGQEISKNAKDIAQEKRYQENREQGMGGFQARFSAILPTAQKSKPQEEKNTPNKQEFSQTQFDQFLIDNWLSVSMELSKSSEKLSKFEEQYKRHISDLGKIQNEYDKLDEKNQGFLGLWESKEQKQRKQELADEFQNVAKLRDKARESYQELSKAVEQFKQDKIEPVRKQIEKIQADNPELKMRNVTQLNSMKLKGVAEWHKESQQRKLEWDRFEQKRQQERALERKSGLSL